MVDQTDQHVFYHLYDLGTKVNLKLEKNSRGYNWEATVLNAKSVDEAIEILKEAELKLSESFARKVENAS